MEKLTPMIWRSQRSMKTNQNKMLSDIQSPTFILKKEGVQIMGAKYRGKIDSGHQIIVFILICLVCYFPGLNRVAKGNDFKWLSAVEENLDALKQDIEQKGYSFTAEYNPALDYTIEELCGLVEPEDAEKMAVFQPLLIGDVPLPSSFDWRDKEGVTPVKDQGGCGACWAFATIAALESAIKIRTGITEDLSEQYLVSCNVEKPKWSCRGGWWAHDYHLSKVPPGEPGAGIVYEVDFPYTEQDDSCNQPHDHNCKINSWSYIGTSFSTPSVEQIKQAIYTYGPVCAAVRADFAFRSYTGGVFDKDATGQVNHGILLVGWNDNYTYKGNTYGVWILKNSWGSAWGDNGYMYITYNTSSVGYAANFVDFRGNVLYTTTEFRGDVSGIYNAISVSNDSHYHAASTISGLNDSHYHTASTISGLGVSDFSSSNISQWNNDAGYIKSNSTLSGLVRSTASGNSYFTGGKVGIGTSRPEGKLDVAGSDGSSVHIDTYGNVYLRDGQGQKNWELQTGDDGSFELRVSGRSISFFTSTGNVGIGIRSPSQTLSVGGGIGLTYVPVWDGTDDNDLTWNGFTICREGSSRRYKQNIRPFKEDFRKILRLEATQYQMREGYGEPGKWLFGYIAEELEENGLTELVNYDSEGRPDGIKYKKMCIYLNEIVKEHEQDIEELKKVVQAQQKKIEELEVLLNERQ